MNTVLACCFSVMADLNKQIKEERNTRRKYASSNMSEVVKKNLKSRQR